MADPSAAPAAPAHQHNLDDDTIQPTMTNLSPMRSSSAAMRAPLVVPPFVQGPSFTLASLPPSPVSGSFSRSTSPGKLTPAQSNASEVSSAAAGLFERDVEFSAEHMLNSQEAVDVGVPAVLSKAATVLTADDIPPEEMASIIRSASSSSLAASIGGWQSPGSDNFFNADLASSGRWHSPSPRVPSNYRSRDRNISPSRSPTSYSSSPPDSNLFTPGTSPSPPLIQRDQDGKATELATGMRYQHASSPIFPSLSAADLYSHRSGSSSPSSGSPPASSSPIQYMSSLSASSLGVGSSRQASQPPSPTSSTDLWRAHRSESEFEPSRSLSFVTYADILNSERAETPLTETPLGFVSAPSSPLGKDTMEAMDFDQLVKALPRSEVLEDGDVRGRSR